MCIFFGFIYRLDKTKSRLARRGFSPKKRMNKFVFVAFFTIQGKKPKFVCSFFGRIYGGQICFWFSLTFELSQYHYHWYYKITSAYLLNWKPLKHYILCIVFWLGFVNQWKVWGFFLPFAIECIAFRNRISNMDHVARYVTQVWYNTKGHCEIIFHNFGFIWLYLKKINPTLIKMWQLSAWKCWVDLSSKSRVVFDFLK